MLLQKVELKASKVVHVGTCDNSAGNYALAKKKMTMEVGLNHLHPKPYTLRLSTPPGQPCRACVADGQLPPAKQLAEALRLAQQSCQGGCHFC